MVKNLVQLQTKAPRASRPTWHQMDIERFAPFGSSGKKETMIIPWEEIRPTIRLLRGSREADFHLSSRIIFDYLLVFFLDGTGRYVIGNEEIEVQKRHLLLVPPFTRNSISMKGSHFFTSIHFDWKPHLFSSSRLSERAPYQVRFPSNVQIPQHQILTVGDSLTGQLQHILELWQEKTVIARLLANTLLSEVLITLLKRAATKASAGDGHPIHIDQKRVEMIIHLMQENLAGDLSLEKMAQAAGLGIAHFSHIFRKSTGHSPIEYLIKLRLQKAKELLGDFHLSIKEVAYSSGFKDYSHFSMMFTRAHGVSPSQYRETTLAESYLCGMASV